MPDERVITGTLDELVVGEGESVTLRGSVVGDVEVQQGGSLIHEGLITGLLYVEDGGHLQLRGRADRVERENPDDIELHGLGRPADGYSQLPFTGPVGWGAIDAVWGRAVAELDKAVDSGGLGPYLQQRKEDTTEDVFRATTAAMAVAGRTDAQLWALLSAAIFNPAESARIRGAGRRRLSSPEDCRERLPWSDVERYLDSPPELFIRLLPHVDRSGRSLAFDCYEALSAVMRAMLAVSEPTDEAVAAIEAFRTTLREQASAASPGPLPAATKPAAPKRPRATRARAVTAASAAPARAAAPTPARARAISAKTDPVDAALCELDNLVGLSSIKEEIQRLGAFAYIERQRMRSGLPETDITRHLVMTGNPGTGKTTVARLLGAIYVGYGLLQTGQVVEVTRSELIDKYLGKTDENVKEAFNRASGGILFIDEAYSLVRREGSEPDYGRIAVDTMVPLMENRRREMMVVAAGYPEPMRQFLRSNPGLEGRFGTTIHFPNYSDAELLKILRRLCEQGAFALPPDAEDAAGKVMAGARERMGERFHNGRMVDRLFEKMVQRHHHRLYQVQRRERGDSTAAELTMLSAADLPTVEELVPTVDDETVGARGW